MKERILKLITEEKISAAEFADRIGVQRSNVSHILNGRNNPGFLFIQKVLETFPTINSRWLLTGEGIMYEGKENFSEKSNYSENLFSGQPEESKVLADISPTGNDLLNSDEKQEQFQKSEKIIEIELASKKVIKVLFFYDDHTFEDFLPANKM